MFLNKTLEQNRPLVEYAFHTHREGTLLPDTYLLDLDMIRQNAGLLIDTANKNGVKLYFMLKQIGRIPAIGRMLSQMGFSGAVCVDFREALHLLDHGIPLGNVGHLVQTPKAALKKIVSARPDIMTVYTVEKAAEISSVCLDLGLRQDIMLRVIDPADNLFPGQYGGFWFSELAETLTDLEKLEGVRIAGVCSFPCLTFDEKNGAFLPSPNLKTVQKSAALLAARGHGDLQINLPSATCVRSLPLIAENGGTHAEPGHGLTGTTPYHAMPGSGPERPAILYLSEISHNLGETSYCYAGGHYRRGHLENALTGPTLERASITRACGPDPENIDYHFELAGRHTVSDPVVMSFRTQIFVTRSEVALIEGLSTGSPHIEGIYSAQGLPLRQG